MQTIKLIEPDDEAYAEYSANFSAYNASNSSWDWKSYSCVVRNGGQLVAGGRGTSFSGFILNRNQQVAPDTSASKCFVDP